MRGDAVHYPCAKLLGRLLFCHVSISRIWNVMIGICWLAADFRPITMHINDDCSHLFLFRHHFSCHSHMYQGFMAQYHKYHSLGNLCLGAQALVKWSFQRKRAHICPKDRVACYNRKQTSKAWGCCVVHMSVFSNYVCTLGMHHTLDKRDYIWGFSDIAIVCTHSTTLTDRYVLWIAAQGY